MRNRVMTGPLDRRRFLAGSGAALAAAALPFSAVPPARAANPRGVPLHGLSAFGELKYPEGFDRLDYASVDAPKGGRFAFTPPNWFFNQNPQTFNTLNTFTLKNDAPPRMELCYDALMGRAWDEPDAIYGILARTVTISEDGNVVSFEMRPEATFSTGLPVTGNDVAYSLLAFKGAGHPQLQLPMRPVENVEATGEHSVDIVFDGTQGPRDILTVATLPVFSSDFMSYRQFEDRSSDPIPGSGPYEVGVWNFGRFIEYRRRPDYWGRDLWHAAGQNNFDSIRVEFYAEREVAFEAFKKGELNYRQEFTSKTWATGYDFPAIEDGRVVKREVPGEARPKYQQMTLNMRREKFADPRVRRAIALCFDFEWTNEKLFYNAYTRSQSPFAGSEFMTEGMPEPDVLALLEPHRDAVPEAAFGEAPLLPASDGSGFDRALLREASRLLAEAGWEREGGRLVKDGKPLGVEFLIRASVFERVYGPFVENLKRVGIDGSIRLVDPAQYANRLDSFDYDMVGAALSLTATPTEDGLRNMFHSDSRDNPAGYNWAGIADPVIDDLVVKAGAATTRDELVAAMRAIDRVVRANQYLLPSWTADTHRVAHWDVFGWGEKPDYAFYPEQWWWHDEAKAAAIGRG